MAPSLLHMTTWQANPYACVAAGIGDFAAHGLGIHHRLVKVILPAQDRDMI